MRSVRYVFVLLVVAFLLRLPVGLVGMRVHAPHTLRPLPVDHAALLFAEACREEEEEEEENSDVNEKTKGGMM